MKKAIACAVAAFIAVLLFLVFAIFGDAHGHQAPSGWFYEAACCSNKDCAPISDDDVIERDGGFYIKSRDEFVAFKDTRQGRDHQYHLCVNEVTNTRLCFYRKFSGA